MQERFRQDDILTRDEREGDRFLLFLSGRRAEGKTPFRWPRTSASWPTASRSYLNPRSRPPHPPLPDASVR